MRSNCGADHASVWFAAIKSREAVVQAVRDTVARDHRKSRRQASHAANWSASAKPVFVSNLINSTLARPRGWLRARRVQQSIDAAAALRARDERLGALRALEQARTLDPRNALVHCLIGQAYAEQGLYDLASASFEHALVLKPAYLEAYLDLGTLYRLQGDAARALEAYRHALQIAPLLPITHFNIASVLVHQRELRQALEHLRVAHKAMPGRGDVLRMLVSTLLETGEFDEAHGLAQSAVEEDSTYEAWLSLGLVYQKLHRPADSVACFRAARELNSEDPELYNYIAMALQELGQHEEAILGYDEALARRPDFPLARFHRSLTCLSIGDFTAGWKDYELRLISETAPARARRFPRWDGGTLENRWVLAYCEQGLGDEIMFASCLPQLIEDAGHTVVECSAKLKGLFERSFSRATVLASTEQARLGAMVIDYEVPLGSLPRHYRRSLTDFPQHTGYLQADPERVTKWRKKLAELGPGMKVGISWRGGTHNTRSPLRSIDLERWDTIFGTPGVCFVNLQYTEEAESELNVLAEMRGTRVAYWPEAIADYEETAALVTALDLTLSVCTAVVHLAGALGRPVWVMAPYSPEWRYGCSGDTMPWYPTARILRQERFGEWDTVLDAVAARLHELGRSRMAMSV